MKLSVSMIVKNEEACIADCLKSVRDADEIVVLDTGSTDGTAQAIADLGMSNVRYVQGEYQWKDDFADARNVAMSKCSGDWILTIDADERLNDGGIQVIKASIEPALGRFDVASVKMKSCGGDSIFTSSRLIRAASGARWKDRAHENITGGSGVKPIIPATIAYTRSPAHDNDPERSIRILRRQFSEQPDDPRTMYYLAREHWYRKEYVPAADLFKRYVKASKFLAEKSDAYLYLARICWAMSRGDEAREYCMDALTINANFREALLFMAQISWEHNAKAWREYAKLATNENVLFVRN